MFMATVDTLPQHQYEIVGLVHASEPIAAGSAPMAVLLDALADQATAMGADAVIGIRMSEVSMPGMSRERLRGASPITTEAWSWPLCWAPPSACVHRRITACGGRA